MRFCLAFACLIPIAFGWPATTLPPRDVPKDCLVKWSDWSDCTKSCGDGKQSRVATILQRPVKGGKPCPPVTDLRHCNTFPCKPNDPPKTTTTKKPLPLTTTTRAAVVTPSDQPPIMCSMLPDGNYKSGKCQRIYFTCASQKLTTLSCPKGLIYDPANDWCDVPLNTEECTGTKPTPAPELSTTQRPIIDVHFDCKEKSDGDFPDPKLPCSNIYFTCSNGVASRRKCPSNLWFDPEELRCDSFQRVPICSGRPRPVETTTLQSTIETTSAPFDCVGKKSGNYADPTKECSHVYYACHAGITDTFLCPEDLSYDASRDLCDAKEYIVACGGQPYVPPTTVAYDETTIPANVFDCWGKADGFYSDPKETCSSKYFACVGMKAFEMHCQEGLIYSPTLAACSRSEETFECTGTSPAPLTTTEFVPSTTEAIPFDCSSVANGFYNNPDKKCSELYYSCSGGIALRLHCPVGTFFDPENSWCEFYENVFECSGERKPPTEATEPPTEATTEVPEYDCSRLEDGLYPIPLEKCSQLFFSCSNGFTHKTKCPSGLYFDPQFSVCDSYGNIFACTGRERRTTTPRTTKISDFVTTEKYPFDCVGQADGEHADPLNKCSSIFYVCSHDITYKQVCPQDLYFHAEQKVCMDWLDVFDCAGKTRPTFAPIETTPGPLPKEVPIDCTVQPDGDYANPQAACSPIFFTCSNKNGFQRECPFGLHFDIELRICDLYANVPACSGRPRPITTESTPFVPIPTEPSLYDCTSKSNGNYPAGDCEDHFFVCVGGHASRQNCPRGLRFDAEFNLCNFGEYMPTCGGVREETTTPREEITVTPNVYPVDCSKLEDGNVVDPESACSGRFFMCANGITFEQKCPSGLRYHQEKDECDVLSEIPSCAGVIPTGP